MKISTLLDHIDSGHMALPEFQRGYVWNRTQVRGLFDSLYRGHPIGGLLVWVTQSTEAAARGDGPVAAGTIRLLLDGQQRITSLYGVARGKPPTFFDGNAKAFTGLRFHLDDETFAFYQPVKMKDDPKWIDVTEVFQAGSGGVASVCSELREDTAFGDYLGRVLRLLSILERDLYAEELTGADKTVNVVVDIFNRVNSGGTKLSKGDLALAKICSDWPEARDTMRAKLQGWEDHGYAFNLDWLLRTVNTVLTGEALFLHLHDQPSEKVKAALHTGCKHIDQVLTLIADRLGLDHDRVFFAKFAVPVMARFLDQRGGTLSATEQDKLLFWYFQAGMWGRFSGSTETWLNRDLQVLDESGGDLDALLAELRRWRGSLRVTQDQFTGNSLGSRFYPVLYALTRMGEARDFGNGNKLSVISLGKMSRLEVHHIFPKALLKKLKLRTGDVNALANFCFLTKSTNLSISDHDPAVYLAEVEASHPGVLASQWIPMDRNLWKLENWSAFYAARRQLLADALNERMASLLHGDTGWMETEAVPPRPAAASALGSVADEEEAALLARLNQWVQDQGLPSGEVSHELVDEESGDLRAVIDLAWPRGLQTDLSEPVAVLLNESPELRDLARDAGFRVYRKAGHFKRHVKDKVLAESSSADS